MADRALARARTAPGASEDHFEPISEPTFDVPRATGLTFGSLGGLARCFSSRQYSVHAACAILSNSPA